MKEIWKEIKGFEGRYSVSTLGNIRNDKSSRLLSPNIGNHGYRKCSWRENGIVEYFLVHRVVAKTFIPNPDGKRTVNHIDGDKLNNRVENLEWATDSEQQLHALDIGLRPPQLTGYDSKASKTIYQFDLQGNFIKEYGSTRCAEKELNKRLHISEVCNGKRKTSGGYIWSYSK